MGLLDDFKNISGKNADDMSIFLATIEHYLDHYQDGRFVQIIDNFKEKMKIEQWKKFRQLFIELEEKLAYSPKFYVFVIKNEAGLFDIFVTFSDIDVVSGLSYRLVINEIAKRQVDALVLEGVDRENATRFVEAYYLMSRLNEEATKSSRQKSSSVTFVDIKDNRATGNPHVDKAVYYDREIVPFFMKNLSLPEFRIRSFSDMLDAVYENKFLGTKIRQLKHS